MPSDIWINLPVKDVKRARDFFAGIGFSLNQQFGNGEDSAALVVGQKGVIVMLFDVTTFSGFSGHRIADTAQGTEVLFSIGVDSRDAVDEMVGKVKMAGGTVFGEPTESQGWMYGAGFVDPDGHRWNVLYMDMSRIPRP